MKKVLSIVSAALVAITAAAQSPDTTSTVVGRKLNFEAPLFGLTMKNVKPKWSMIYFAGVRGGYSFRLDAPDEMNASGYFGELDLIEIRYRPWRDGNVFSCGLTYSIERHMLKKGYAFDNDGSFIPIPAGWLNNQSSSVEEIFPLTWDIHANGETGKPVSSYLQVSDIRIASILTGLARPCRPVDCGMVKPREKEIR